jgi:hypothetical protein
MLSGCRLSEALLRVLRAVDGGGAHQPALAEDEGDDRILEARGIRVDRLAGAEDRDVGVDADFEPFCSATTTVTGVDSLGGRWLPA